jgi:hypothetical protein
MQVRNISTGPRGAYLGGVLVEAEPGEVIEADDFAPEWFEAVAGCAAKPVADDGEAPKPRGRPRKEA